MHSAGTRAVKAMAMQPHTRRVGIGSGPAWTAPASVSSELNQRASMSLSLPGYIVLLSVQVVLTGTVQLQVEHPGVETPSSVPVCLLSLSSGLIRG